MRTGTNLSLIKSASFDWQHNGQRIFPTVSNSAILSNNYVSLLSDRLSTHAYKRENGVTNEAIVIEWAAAAPGEDLEVAKKRWDVALLGWKCCCFVRKPSWQIEATLS